MEGQCSGDTHCRINTRPGEPGQQPNHQGFNVLSQRTPILLGRQGGRADTHKRGIYTNTRQMPSKLKCIRATDAKSKIKRIILKKSLKLDKYGYII